MEKVPAETQAPRRPGPVTTRAPGRPDGMRRDPAVRKTRAVTGPGGMRRAVQPLCQRQVQEGQRPCHHFCGNRWSTLEASLRFLPGDARYRLTPALHRRLIAGFRGVPNRRPGHRARDRGPPWPRTDPPSRPCLRRQTGRRSSPAVRARWGHLHGRGSRSSGPGPPGSARHERRRRDRPCAAAWRYDALADTARPGAGAHLVARPGPPGPLGQPRGLRRLRPAALRETLSDYRSLHGMRCETCPDGRTLRARVATGDPFDAAPLDMTMPGEDGLPLARFLRETTRAGILKVTARGASRWSGSWAMGSARIARA